MNEEYEAYMQSEAWEAVKESHPDAPICIACDSSRRIHLHHMHYPESIWDTRPSDCCWLCERCHELFHRAVLGERKKYQEWAVTKNRTRLLIEAQRNEEGMSIKDALERILIVTHELERWPSMKGTKPARSEAA